MYSVKQKRTRRKRSLETSAVDEPNQGTLTEEKTTSTNEIEKPKGRNPCKCLVCNAWRDKRTKRCESCYRREKLAQEAQAVEETGKLPPKARIGRLSEINRTNK